ncbi:hypothetical protein [Stackebrandtia nassauensis]|uniref:Uncharacterized protein n=1 Tax=Stackebrandtia nassauensis (strain DSM 44728 / CIP 108903 / NRRL B-16338 / NBRC 102104 / LLR-40K-21) TaxID=446470 RepID=D3Q5D7_STANL|nr:hypothetical protein [Stackebrandtia nassauensis]ADD45997.1 hypothetical protein Snas_6381 [Stackebrandtia nassauensis DSM 44728]
MPTTSQSASDLPATRPISTVASVAAAVVGVAAFFGAGWWLFLSFGAAFFADDTSSSVFLAHAAVLFIALGAAAIGIARGRYFAWLAAVSGCAATVGAGLTQLVEDLRVEPPVDATDAFLEGAMIIPAAVAAAAVILLWLRGVRDWCSSRSGVVWLIPVLGLVIAGGVGVPLVFGSSFKFVVGVGAAAAVVAGLISFAATRRQPSDSKPE